MRYRYAIYCSGNAGRVLAFYEKHSFSLFPCEFIFYDGKNFNVVNELQKISPRVKLIHFDASEVNDVKIKNREAFNEMLLKSLKSSEVDYLFCFGMQIINKIVLGFYKNRIINFHPSLLPAFKGLNAIDQALSTNVKFLGNTAHFVDEGIDTGTIICQSIMNRSAFEKYDDLLSLQVPMLKVVWSKLEADEINNEIGSLDGGGSSFISVII